jgi:cell division protein FtsI/penicillin-binding protein 2
MQITIMERRFWIIKIIFLLSFLVLIARLFYWQVIKADELSTQARRQYQVGKTLSAPRGNILANDGSYLAGRNEGWLVYAAAPEIKEDKDKIADMLAPFFVQSEEEDEESIRSATFDEAGKIKSLLNKSGTVWIPLKHKVDNQTKKNIESLDIDGIGFEEEELREYPESSSSAHLLGFVGKNDEGEDIGYFGLEGYYNLVLSGKPGFISRDSDARGLPILLGDTQEVMAIGGIDLLTNIDKGIQLLVENELKDGIEKYGAKAGTVIVMDPKSGAILATASSPSYDPFYYYKYSNELFKDPSISETFEPGSIFKVLVMAAALDAKVIKPDTKCDICSGPLKVDKYSISTWNDEYFPDSTMTDVIVHSDNVGMAFVGQKLGADMLYDYLDRFGIGKLTGIDLQGEVTPELREKGTWNIVDTATASFGQGVAVTPIQMIRAVSAIANKGILVTPQVVDKLMGSGWSEDIKPISGEKVISEDAASEITAMMVEAAKEGESKWTYLKGFKVAGKTGTAQIPIAGHYDEEKTIASFVGFAPYDDPKFVMLVTLKEPQSSPWASETAAPLWYSIASNLFIHFGVQPED